MKNLILLCSIFLLLSVTLAAAETSGQDNLTTLVKDNLDNIDLNNLPSAVKFILGSPAMNVEVARDSGETKTYGFMFKDGLVSGFTEEGIASPDYIVYLSEASVNDISDAPDSNARVSELYENGSIVIKAQNFMGKIWLTIAGWFA